MSKDEYRIGIVGLGWVAGAHIETFKAVEGAAIVAGCSRRDLSDAQLEAQYGTPMKFYGDFEKMIADPDIDVIDICTPHPMHPDQAVAAAEAGKHLIIEKPIAIDPDGARRIRDAVRAAGVQACVCFECRYSAHFTMVKSILDEGLIGAPHYGEVDYYHGIGPWYGQFEWNVKKDFASSSMTTAGCHALDALMLFMNSPVEEVAAYSTKSEAADFAPYEYDPASVTILKFANGHIGKVASSVDCYQPYYFHVHLLGSEGSLLDNRIYSNKIAGMTKERWSTLETSLVDSGDVNDHPYQAQFQAFIDALKRDRPMPLTDFDTAYETHRVMFASDLSLAEGRPVKVGEIE